MTTLLLIGLQEHEAVPLEAAIGTSGLDLTPIRLLEVRIPDGIDARRSVAVLSGAADMDLDDRVITAFGLALPVMVIMPGFVTRDIDVSLGNIDFCFPPFRAEEFAVRIGLLIARSGGNDSENVVHQGEIRIDLERYEVTVSGRKVDLTFKEYELLRVLASNPGHVYSREALLQTVWEYDYYGGTRTVDVHIRRLRSKINDVEHRFIETVWNVGYRFRTDNN
jgi:DNA-binding winged helix-turn-helix (wHTH) protein